MVYQTWLNGEINRPIFPELLKHKNNAQRRPKHDNNKQNYPFDEGYLAMIRNRFESFILIPMIVLMITTRCDVDHGLGVSKSRIRGTVYLPDMSQKPSFFHEVRIVASTKTLDSPEITPDDFVFSNRAVDLHNPRPTYDLPAPLSKYEFVGALWKRTDESWGQQIRIFGFYGFDPDSFKFDVKPLFLSKEEPVVDNIDIICDWILVGEKGRLD